MIKKKSKIEDDEIEIVPEYDGAEVKVKKIREELKECKKTRDEYLIGWQRAKADFINARRDEENSKDSFRRFTELKILEEFLDLAENFKMAFSAKPDVSDSANNWISGIENIHLQLLKILDGYGISELDDSSGKKFNPEEHESIESVAVEEEEKDNIIIEELRRGYKMNDRVIRPSKVKVGVYKKGN